MIRAVDVAHHYGIRPILKDVNLEIQTGELVTVVGPNGMGKTTLLGVLAGVLWPCEGYVEFDGQRRLLYWVKDWPSLCDKNRRRTASPEGAL